jgi:uncharacterized protein (TIGR02301 family)
VHDNSRRCQVAVLLITACVCVAELAPAQTVQRTPSATTPQRPAANQPHVAPAPVAPAPVAPAPVAPAPVAPAPAAPAPAAPELPPPAYERDLIRLSEILGALSVLHELCGDQASSEVRANMQALLDAEAQTPARREQLAGAYNRFARAYATTHRTCRDTSKAALERFLTDGASVARAISSRFGG